MALDNPNRPIYLVRSMSLPRLIRNPMGCQPQDYDKLTAIIRNCFAGCANVDDVTNAPDGANADCHLVARTVTGDRFGLKLFNVTNTPDGAQRDKLMADLAAICDAPNVCPVTQTGAIAFIPEFQNAVVVNITHWMSNSTSVRHIPTLRKDALRNGGDEYYSQLGEWLAFGLLFAIADRHDGNWVWNDNEQKLAMIDLEFALNAGVTLDHYNQIVANFLSTTPAIANRQMDKLVEGFTIMWQKLIDCRPDLEQLLQQHQFAAGFQLTLLNQGAAGLIEPYANRYRL